MANQPYSREIAQTVLRYLDDDEWNYDFDEELGLIRFSLSLSSKIKHIKYYLDIDTESFNVYALCPLGADMDDETTVREVSEFLHRANYGLRAGNFEMDFHDGEIRYKTYCYAKDSLPSVEAIQKSIFYPAAMFERYGDGILSILFGGLSAQDAIARCEQPRR